MMNYERLLNFNARAELAKRNFIDFIRYTKPDYEFNWHHEYLCEKLMAFATGKIRKLMVFMPPQHGKSELTTRRLPAFMMGRNPDRKMAVCSYSATIASNFNRDIRRINDDKPYYDIFPETSLNENSAVNPSKNTFLRNSEVFEIVGKKGFVKTVGVGGSLTGTPVDIGIIDDPFKDHEEAMSSRIREKVYSWYTDVFATRLHNDSQQLLVMTRWDEEDLAGRILKTDNDWEMVVFQGIKERDMPGDPRQKGEALWPAKHSLDRLQKIKGENQVTFNSLYQQEPKAPKELLVFPEWDEIDEMPHYGKQYGVDFGFPTGIVEVMWHNKNLYLNEIMYNETNPTNRQIIVDLLKYKIDVTKPFVCDSAEPRSIKDLKDGIDLDGKKVKMNAIEAIKGPDSIRFGISKMQECKIYVTRHSQNLKNELNHYQFMTFNGKRIDEPVDAYNHLIDAARYCYVTLGVKKTVQPSATFSR
jgi:hypothetical protein